MSIQPSPIQMTDPPRFVFYLVTSKEHLSIPDSIDPHLVLYLDTIICFKIILNLAGCCCCVSVGEIYKISINQKIKLTQSSNWQKLLGIICCRKSTFTFPLHYLSLAATVLFSSTY